MVKLALLLTEVPRTRVLRRVARTAKGLNIRETIFSPPADRDNVVGLQPDLRFCATTTQAAIIRGGFQCLPLGTGERAAVAALFSPVVGDPRVDAVAIIVAVSLLYEAVLCTIAGISALPDSTTTRCIVAVLLILPSLQPIRLVSFGMVLPLPTILREVLLWISPIVGFEFRQDFVPLRPVSSPLTRSALWIQAVLRLTRWRVIGHWQRLAAFRATFIGDGKGELVIDFGHLSTSNVLGSCPRWLQPRGGFVLPKYSTKSEV